MGAASKISSARGVGGTVIWVQKYGFCKASEYGNVATEKIAQRWVWVQVGFT